MLFGRFILALNALTFLAYGIVCVFSPQVPAGFIGLILTANGDTTATIEFTAMYGGLQSAIGLVLGWYALRRERVPTGLGVMATLFAGLGIARAIGLAAYGVDHYNGGGVIYELGFAVIAAICWLLTRRHD